MSPDVGVALIGRNTLVREGLRHILTDAGLRVEMSVLGSEDLGPAGSQDWIVIVILDRDCPDFETHTVASLHDRFPKARVVLLATEFDFGAVRRAFKAGAVGYLINEIACDRLVGMLHLVALGEKVFPSQLAKELVDRAGMSQYAGPGPTITSASLSVREVEILRCLIMGLPNKVISRRLSISEATVKVHVKAVLRKLQVTNRTQAAIWATSRGLQGLDADEPVGPTTVRPGIVAASSLAAEVAHSG